MDLNLQGKNAFVGGSSKGIGKASAIELALLGANVTLVSRNEDALKEAITDLDTGGDQIHDYLVADYSSPKQLKKQVEEYLVSTKKIIHILVNNTGGPPGGQAIDANTDEYLQAFNNHLICNQILTQAFVDGMKSDKYGRIINIISTSVKAPIKGLGVSNTIRGAVGNWSKTLSFELGEYGITVNNILPGATDTERIHEIVKSKAQKTGFSAEQVLENMKNEVPIKRLAHPNEVGAAVAFLASPAASYINGINVPVDGGRTPSL